MPSVNDKYPKPSLTNAIKGGALYGAGVFAIGFGLGIARTIFLLPTFGETIAVLMELPVILGLSWVLCGRSITKMKVTPQISKRLVMGSVAFLLLISAELALWQIMFDTPTSAFFARYTNLAGIMGLGAQVLFALFPLLQLTQNSE